MSDRAALQRAIGELVEEYETIHSCEVSSIWITHYDGHPRTIEVLVTTAPKVIVA